MKRSAPLTRRKGLKPGKPPKRKSWIKRKSSKQRKLERDYREERNQYCEDHPCICGSIQTECHEIPAGSYRRAAFKEPCAWLSLCRKCHDRWQSTEPVKQYALKKWQSPETWDRVRLNRLRGRADEAITESEVDEATAELKRKGVI